MAWHRSPSIPKIKQKVQIKAKTEEKRNVCCSKCQASQREAKVPKTIYQSHILLHFTDFTAAHTHTHSQLLLKYARICLNVSNVENCYSKIATTTTTNQHTEKRKKIRKQDKIH